MHVMTENEARSLAQRIERGGRIVVPEGTILTPMARDYLHGRGIEIVENSSSKKADAGAPRSSSGGGDDALINAVAEEVKRALKPGGAQQTTSPAAMLAQTGRTGSQSGNRAVVWGIGGDRPGILADVAELLGKRKINILEISQTILSGVFAMVMIVDLSNATGQFGELKAELEEMGKKLGVNLSAQRDEIFQYMHRI